MSDPFTELATTPEPFSAVESPTTTVSVVTPKAAADTAQSAAIALSDSPTFHEAMSQSQNYLDRIIASNNDQDIRREAAHRDLTNSLEGLASLAHGDPSNIELQNAVIQAGVNLNASDDTRRAKYALEKLKAERLQAYVAEDNPTAARTLMDLELHGDVLERMRANQIKQMIFDRLIDNATQDNEAKPWFSSLAGFVLGSITGYNTWGSGELVDVDKHARTWMDNLLTGKTIENQAGTLWTQIPVEDFSDYVQDHLIPAVQKHSTFMGFFDQSKYLNTLHELNAPGNPTEQNFGDSITNLSGVGAGMLVKSPLTLVRALASNGSRKLAAETVAKAVTDVVERGTTAAAEATGLTETDIVDHVLPTAVNPTTGKIKWSDVMSSRTPVAPQSPIKWSDVMNGSGPVVPKPPLSPIKWSEVMTGGVASAAETLPPPPPIKWSEVMNGSVPATSKVATPTNIPVGPSTTVPLAGDIQASLARAQAVVKSFDIAQAGRLTPEEISNLEAATVKELDRWFGDNMVHDVDFEDVKHPDNTSTRRANFTVGSFEDEEEAARFADEYSIGKVDPTQLVQDTSGKWSVRVSRDMSEFDAYSNTLAPQAKGFLGRFLFGARQIGDKWGIALGQHAFDSRGKVAAYMSDMYGKYIERLPKASKELLDQITLQGNLRDTWFSQDQFRQIVTAATGRSATAEEWSAYVAHKEMNDVAHILLNSNRVKNLVIRGFETVTIEGNSFKYPVKRVNGRVVREPKLSVGDRVYNASDDIYHGKNRPLTEADIARYKEQGYVVTNLEEAVELKDGTKVTTVINHPRQMTREPLRHDQLPYKAGGRRMYQDGMYYAKQAVIGKQPDGDMYMAPPKVFIAGTRAEVDYWTTRVEAARQLAIREGGATIAELNKVLPKSYPAEKFLGDLESGAVRKDQAVRTMFDRERMPEYKPDPNIPVHGDVNESSVDGIMRTNGRLFYSGRGQVLRDFEGQNALTLSPTKTINRALAIVAGMSTFDDYKTSMIQRWFNTFGEHLDNAKAFKDPMTAFRDGVISKDTNEVIRQGAEAQRDVIKRTLNWQGEFQRQEAEYGRRLAEFIMGDDPYSTRHKIGKDLVQWYDHNDPVQAIRGLATDLKLGLFNPGQFVLQLGTAVAAITMDGTHGIQGLTSFWALRSFLAKNGTEHTLNTWIGKGMHTALGMDAAEFKAYMKNAKKGGFFEIGHNHVYLGDGGSLDANGAFRQAGRAFLVGSEFINRAVANRIAWEEAKGVSKDFASQAFNLALATSREKWSASMSAVSGAAWQRGITSIPTQFWAYNARMLEMMLGKEFTPKQRIRLVLGQMLLYGSSGLPLLPLVSEQINKHNGGAPPINTTGGVIERGLFDAVLYHVSGADVSVGKRIGTGSFVTDLPVIHEAVEALFGASGYGDRSVAEVMGGVTGSIAGDGWDTIKDLVRYGAVISSGESLDPPTAETFKRVVSNISTVSNLYKAAAVFQYGTWLSTKGSTQVDGLPTVNGFAALLGFAPGQIDDLSAKMLYEKDLGKLVDDYTKTYRNYQMRWANEPSNRRDIENEMAVLQQLTPDAVKTKGLKKLRNTTPDSVLDSVTNQVEKDKALENAVD